MATYEVGIERLIERVHEIDRSGWSPTPKRRECEAIAEAIDGVVKLLERHGHAQTAIEEVHDRLSAPLVGEDGLPQPAPDFGSSYKATIWHMRLLAQSARLAANELPNSREAPALKFAALGLLHLFSWHDMPRPTIYYKGLALRELTRVCEAARMFRSQHSLRNTLVRALRDFDATDCPPEICDLLL